MSWVKLQSDTAHKCKFPLPPGREEPDLSMIPWNGRKGDLWRCTECNVLWRIGDACNICDTGETRHQGQCKVGSTWRPAGLWDRIKYHNKGHVIDPDILWPKKDEAKKL